MAYYLRIKIAGKTPEYYDGNNQIQNHIWGIYGMKSWMNPASLILTVLLLKIMGWYGVTEMCFMRFSQLY